MFHLLSKTTYCLSAVLDLGIGTDKCSTVLGAYLVKEFAHVYAGGSRRECFDFASRDVAELCLEGIDVSSLQPCTSLLSAELSLTKFSPVANSKGSSPRRTSSLSSRHKRETKLLHASFVCPLLMQSLCVHLLIL